jgi:predicted nucleic acid-binding protein
MFLEFWMICVFFILFAVAMRNMYLTGYRKGALETIANTTDLTLYALKSQGLIDIVEDINGEEKIVKALPSEEEFEKMMELVREQIRDEENQNDK